MAYLSETVKNVVETGAVLVGGWWTYRDLCEDPERSTEGDDRPQGLTSGPTWGGTAGQHLKGGNPSVSVLPILVSVALRFT